MKDRLGPRGRGKARDFFGPDRRQVSPIQHVESRNRHVNESQRVGPPFPPRIDRGPGESCRVVRKPNSPSREGFDPESRSTGEFSVRSAEYEAVGIARAIHPEELCIRPPGAQTRRALRSPPHAGKLALDSRVLIPWSRSVPCPSPRSQARPIDEPEASASRPPWCWTTPRSGGSRSGSSGRSTIGPARPPKPTGETRWPISRWPSGPRRPGRARPQSTSRRQVGPWARFRLSSRRGIAVVSLTDQALIKEDDLSELAGDLLALVEAGHLRIVLDFFAVERLSSWAARTINDAVRACFATDGGRGEVLGTPPGNLRDLRDDRARSGRRGLSRYLIRRRRDLARPPRLSAPSPSRSSKP